MSGWTPSTGQVRDAYIRGMRFAFIASAGGHGEEFDRWFQGVAGKPVVRVTYAGPGVFPGRDAAPGLTPAEAAVVARFGLTHPETTDSETSR